MRQKQLAESLKPVRVRWNCFYRSSRFCERRRRRNPGWPKRARSPKKFNRNGALRCLWVKNAHIPANPHLTSRAVASILQAMQREGVRRIVYVSAYGAGDSWLRIPWWGRAFLRLSKVRYSMADHTRSERLLSGSGTDWTALRPMLLDDTRCAQPARPMRQGDSLMSKVSREALARTVLAMLGDRSSFGRAIALSPSRNESQTGG